MTEVCVHVNELLVSEIRILKTKSENKFKVFTFSNIKTFF